MHSEQLKEKYFLRQPLVSVLCCNKNYAHGAHCRWFESHAYYYCYETEWRMVPYWVESKFQWYTPQLGEEIASITLSLANFYQLLLKRCKKGTLMFCVEVWIPWRLQLVDERNVEFQLLFLFSSASEKDSRKKPGITTLHHLLPPPVDYMHLLSLN